MSDLQSILSWLLAAGKNPIVLKTAIAGIIVISGVIAARYLSKSIGLLLLKAGITEKLKARGFQNPESIIENSIKYFIFALAFIAALNRPGIVKTFFSVAMLALASLAGIIIFLTCKDAISNFACGVAIFSRQAVKEGMLIKLDNGISGKIQSCGFFEIRITNPKGQTIVLPNSFVLKNMHKLKLEKFKSKPSRV